MHCGRRSSINIDAKSDEVELMNHPGFYKNKNLNYSFHSDLNLETIGKRKKYYSSKLKTDNDNEEYQYINLNDEEKL